jgi:hypothetical protein
MKYRQYQINTLGRKMMRIYLYILLITGVFGSNLWASSIFDRIRQRTDEAVREAVDDAIDEAVDEAVNGDESEQTQQDTPAGQNQQSTVGNAQTIQTIEDLYGQWEGVVTPSKAGSSFMSGMTVHITLTPGFESMRVTGAGTRCLAELEPTDTFGQYQATFIDETQSCGSRALTQFASNGQVTINWHDMPNISTAERTYSGQLTRTPPYERRWSSSSDQRENLDIVGLRLGITYEEALDYLKANHPDLDQTLRYVTDAGTRSLILNMTENRARKVGPAVFGEQLTLVFESQTPDEMEVEQTPEILAAIEERERIMQERNEMLAQQRSARRTRDRNAQPEVQSPLPEIPDQPELRPAGAEAELVVISRQIQYGNRQGPHPDNVLGAMSNKYSRPSIQIKKPGSAGEQYLVGWVYDAAGNFVPDAQDSPCDLLSVTGYDLKERAHHYAVLNNVPNIFYPVMISPHCGLNLISEIRTESDGSVWRIVTTAYDQQRLLGDEWYRMFKRDEAMVAEQKAKSGAIKQRDIPDF